MVGINLAIQPKDDRTLINQLEFTALVELAIYLVPERQQKAIKDSEEDCLDSERPAIKSVARKLATIDRALPCALAIPDLGNTK